MDPDCERSTMSCSGSTSLHGGRRRFFARSAETARRLEQQSCITETQHVLPDEALDTERDVKVREWKTLASERPLKFLVAGRGGVGKSSLINNLLELNSSSEEGAEEGFTGGATTQAVRRHTGSKHGIQVIAYDTPGFQDLQLPEEEIIAELVDETDSIMDVCLYCASLEMRVCQEDRRICSLLTNAFKMLWEKAIFVLTFANTDKIRSRGDHEALIERYKSNLKDCLRNAGVPVNTISNITFCTTGYMDPQLEYEDCSNWQERLYVEIIKKADPAITPALLKLRWGPKAVKSAMGGSVVGAAGGAALGAGIGAGVGLLGGPVGIGVGAAAGGVAGALFGTMAGPVPATGMRALHSEELKTIVKAKYIMWKKQQKKKRISHCKQQ